MSPFAVKRLWMGCALLVCLPLSACAAPLVYYAKPTSATVVDADTQQPIKGAVVVARWVLAAAGGGDRVMDWEYHEVLTDDHGNFHIPGWGPKLRPSFAELTYRDPEMIVFKSGYEAVYRSNEVTSHPSQASVRVSEWNGKTIALKPFRGSIEERVRQLEFVRDRFDHGPPLNALYTELSKERDLLGAAGKGLFIRIQALTRERP